MQVPIEIFLTFIGLAFAMSIISFLPKNKIHVLLMIAGAMITFWAIETDTIILGKIPITSIVSGSTTTYAFVNNTFEFTQWPKILFGLIGSVLTLSGALTWVDERKPTRVT